ncbi:alpha/beta fold hydrolase [Psychromonas aquimarina]|uniref:alpha/beta fold hydrolase n=1 Tax=Psychromonas aquimarina TaxID=444919 RepID=UPI000415AA6E|nr:alpha/beta hydrolase [Psychromonas aquimarina]
MPVDTSIEEIHYQTGTLSIHGLACGDQQSEVILCLHGWLDNAASFSPLMSCLQGRRVIAIDLPGHGLSSHRSPDAHYHFVDWVYDLVQLFEVNGWQKIDILGHSMGGMIASAFAAVFPEKVKSLTLIDSIGFICNEEIHTSRQLRQGLLSRLKGSPVTAAKTNFENKQKRNHATIESAVNARVIISGLAREHAQIIVRRGIRREENGYAWRADERLKMLSPYRLTTKQAEQLISDIHCPVLLIHASKGLNMVSSALEHFAPFFKDLHCRQLPGGHHIHMEHPQQTAELIRSFILTSELFGTSS